MIRLTRLPSPFVDAIPLVLLPGWGMSSSVWEELLPTLTRRFEVAQVDWDESVPEREWPKVLAMLAETMGRPAIWMGWSLGGQLALDLADRYPASVIALVMIASNPAFVQRDGWACGMSREVFADFRAQVAQDASTALSRFAGLQAQGGASSRTETKRLRAMLDRQLSGEFLLLTLALLESLDLREAWARVDVPVLSVLGRHDALVPVSLAPSLARLNERAQVRIVESAHAPQISVPTLLLDALEGMLTGTGIAHER